MSIHSLPSTYILRDLQDVSLPQSVSWAPVTIGWKILLVLLVLLLIYFFIQWVRQKWQNRYRKEALQAVSSLCCRDPQFSVHLFTIIKTVLVYINPYYAPLQGQSFLDQLVEMTSEPLFFSDALSLRWMASLFDPTVVLTELECQRLQTQLLHWLQVHKQVREEK
ncbi:TPA: DUF4381 domain-containing protein [Photobacterium damselae]